MPWRPAQPCRKKPTVQTAGVTRVRPPPAPGSRLGVTYTLVLSCLYIPACMRELGKGAD